MITATDTQTDPFAWARDLEQEDKRIAEINAARVRNRGYLVFATDPSGWTAEGSGNAAVVWGSKVGATPANARSCSSCRVIP